MEPRHAALAENIGQLKDGIDRLRDDDGFSELLRIIHRPGWTTPAELTLVSGLVEIMNRQVRELTGMRDLIFRGCREVGATTAQK